MQIKYALKYCTYNIEKLYVFLFATESQVKQWITKYGWCIQPDGCVFITNQEENIKTKNITEKITFDSE